MPRPRLARRAAVAVVLLFLAATLARGQGADSFLNRPFAQWLQELRDRRPPVRRSAAFALGKIGSQASVPALLDALHDASPAVREASAFALGEIGLPPVPDTASAA